MSDQFEKLATFEEIDRDRTEHEHAVADVIDEGTFCETGGELGQADWEFAQVQAER